MVSHPEQYHDVLQRIMKAELAGVMRYNHYALMVRRPPSHTPTIHVHRCNNI
jgi:bacterioferritin (cytochrome b1)